jgi:hypothetical protein
MRDCLQLDFSRDWTVVPVDITGALTLATLAAILVLLAVARWSTWCAMVGTMVAVRFLS